MSSDTTDSPGQEKRLDRETPRPMTADIIAPKRAGPEISTTDFLDHYKNKIRRLGRIITGRLDDPPVSINKVSHGRNTVLGLVRDPAGKEFTIEDMTGRCGVVTKTPEDVAENDVVAVTGLFSGGKLLAGKISRPEIAIKKDIKTSAYGTSFFFLSAIDPDATVRRLLEFYPGGQNFFLVCRGGDTGAWVFCTSGPAVAWKAHAPDASKIIVDSGGKKFKIQNFRTPFTTTADDQSKYFGKRSYVNSLGSAPIFGEDSCAIDIDTDIIFLGPTGKAGAANHKGYTFVTAGEAGETVVIDMSSREARQLNF